MADVMSGRAAWALVQAIRGLTERRAPAPSTGTATLVRRDPDGTAWVMMPGADAETPVNGEQVADAQPGDVVSWRLENGRLSVAGNVTSPSVGERVVRVAEVAAIERERVIERATAAAQAVADAARRVAEATGQHFWTDTSGIHVTQVTQDEWEDANGAGYRSGPNVLLNSTGQLFRDGLTNLLTLTTESGARALTIWDGAGNAASNVLASFGSMVTIGRSTAAHMTVDTDSVDIMDAGQQLMSVEGVNENLTVGGRLSFNGGSRMQGHYYAEGTNYAYKELVVEAGSSSSSVTSTAIMQAVRSGFSSSTGGIPYVRVGTDRVIRLQPTTGRGLELAGSGTALTFTGPSADMVYDLYDSKIQLRLPSSSSARVRVASSTSEVNVYNDHINVQDTSTSYLYPNRLILNDVEGSVSLRIGSTYVGIYDDDNSKWIVGKNKSTGAVYLDEQRMPYFAHGMVGQTNTVTAGGYEDVSVSFGHTYSSAPHVVVGLYSTSTSSAIGSISVAVASVTATGFTARLFNAGSTARTPGFYWAAIG